MKSTNTLETTKEFTNDPSVITALLRQLYSIVEDQGLKNRFTRLIKRFGDIINTDDESSLAADISTEH